MAKKLMFIGIDGCHQATLYGLIDRGEAPFMRSLVENGTRVRRAVTMFPSTTCPCCSTLYTGCWYRSHGILNNEWMDRTKTPVEGKSYIAGLHYALASMDRKLFGWPSIILPDMKKGGSVNNDLQAPTIFEEFTKAGKTSYSFFHYFGKGATRWVRPARPDMLRFAYVENWQKPFPIYEKMLVGRAIQSMRGGLADLMAVYFGCNDGHGHRHGVEGQKDYLRDFVDPQMARLGKALEQRFPNDEIYWAIVADHGQSTLTDADRPKCVWWDTFNPMFEKAGFEKIERSLSDKELEPMDVVASLGTGASLGFYVRDRKSRDWRKAPDFAADLAPALNNFMKANKKLGPFGDFKFPGFLDILLTRERFDEPYRVFANEPPYEGKGRLVSLEEHFAARGAEYIRPIERLRGIDHPKGPDIVLLLNYQDHFNVNEQEAFHPGQHGSLLEDDSMVPMIFSGPGVKRGEIEDALTIDFAPTAASLVGVKMPKADGRVLPVI